MFMDPTEDNMNYFRDISTFGGCTAGPAAALEVLKIIKREKIINNLVSPLGSNQKEIKSMK